MGRAIISEMIISDIEALKLTFPIIDEAAT
jgi:hypothetical protein